MIRTALRMKIRSLYSQGYLAREIKSALGIDGFIYQAALRPSWNTSRYQKIIGEKSIAGLRDLLEALNTSTEA